MICVSLSDKNFENCLQLAKQFELCEIRLDLTQFTKEQIVALFSCGAKLIATFRPGNVTETDRQQMLITAIQSGAKYVDIEFESDLAFKMNIIKVAKENHCDVIISYHNYDETPSSDTLKNIVKQSFSYGADVVKLATMVNKPEDNGTLLSLYEPNKRIVSIGMGELGKISRLAALFSGAEFTFASPSDETAVAPGQISIQNMKKIVELIKNA